MNCVIKVRNNSCFVAFEIIAYLNVWKKLLARICCNLTA